MKLQEERYQKARALVHALKQRQYASLIQKDRNIVGVAFGQRTAHGEVTDEPAMVVYVMRKAPRNFIPSSRLLPNRAYIGGDCVEIDVVETGPLYPLAFTGRDRPAAAGISIGNANEASAGTFGAVVTDLSDNSACILTNNHVIARENAGAPGELVTQPGLFDGGMSPADDIATLKRFVMINASGNTVDGAIAQITGGLGAGNVIDAVKNNIISTASANHPAIGLLFAGSCNRTIMNPIADVLNQLNIAFPNGSSAIASADIGMNVEKVGRTTEYTSSTIKEVDATVTIGYDFGDATFDNQITTAWMSDAGDSGSVVYLGGKGGDENKCGCGSKSAASSLFGVDLQPEQAMAEAVRDKYLRQTRLGKWLVDVFYLNEEAMLERFQRTPISEEDRAFARKMFAKYADDARQAFVHGERSEQRLTEQHIRDARSALKRAERFMSRDEAQAARELLGMAAEYASGRNVRQILAMLNDEKLACRVQEIIGQVGSLRTSRERC
ncbi:MAG: hypothetical protein ABIW83_02760 [Allosphingosinicella sp.]